MSIQNFENRDIKSYLSDVHKLPPNSPSLSTMQVPTDVIGRQAVKAMADAVSGRALRTASSLSAEKLY